MSKYRKMHKDNLLLFVPYMHFNRLWKICLSNADIIVQYFKFTHLKLIIYSILIK